LLMWPLPEATTLTCLARRTHMLRQRQHTNTQPKRIALLGAMSKPRFTMPWQRNILPRQIGATSVERHTLQHAARQTASPASTGTSRSATPMISTLPRPMRATLRRRRMLGKVPVTSIWRPVITELLPRPMVTLPAAQGVHTNEHLRQAEHHRLEARKHSLKALAARKIGPGQKHGFHGQFEGVPGGAK
jgi:hypothetical protein